MNELDKLREMLDKAGIPYETFQQAHERPEYVPYAKDLYGEAGQWALNQVVYGRNGEDPQFWKFDAICQFGSYGCGKGLIECWGELGSDADGEPRVLTAVEAFAIISKDYHSEES